MHTVLPTFLGLDAFVVLSVTARPRAWFIVFVFFFLKRVIDRGRKVSGLLVFANNAISGKRWRHFFAVETFQCVVRPWPDVMGSDYRVRNAGALDAALAPVRRLWELVVELITWEVAAGTNLAGVVHKSAHLADLLALLLVVSGHVDDRSQKSGRDAGH